MTDDTPIFPEGLRALPRTWGHWPDEETAERWALVRGVLEAGLPPARLDEPEPRVYEKLKMFADDEVPPDDWFCHEILREKVKDLPRLTVGRLAEVEAACAADGLDTTDFREGRWKWRIAGWIVEPALYWCGLADDVDALDPWFPELAALHIRRRMAVEQATLALLNVRTLDSARAALNALAVDPEVDEETRERIAEDLREDETRPRNLRFGLAPEE
ncbi:hypothetical protein OG259_32205 [Streptomyces sp. NBC_00250]|uniref:hypothetical protein n=1 Tax=Streptomyces sp. NBC_00250 TaxID=2903641 RepID=UPI002E285ADF|nr:hypothetical protein [Streptomyces sp. NBC_00250]